MHLPKRSSWHMWPVLAGLLAIIFIVTGITVLSKALTVQERISEEIQLTEELDHLRDSFHTLGLIHRVGSSNIHDQWYADRSRLDEQIEQLQTRYPDSPGIAQLPGLLRTTLARTDSLHRQAFERRSSLRDRSASDAVLQILVRRAQQDVDQTSRRVHEEGLAVHAATLNAYWSKARLLLLAACLLAVAVAWLANVSNRLLDKSHLHSVQLDRAKKNLEKTNKELRETMLSKEEKEVMIKEIHHRVKNNLQIVKSLIRFQMDQVKDPRTLELFNECVNRVSAMALVHEQTYLSKDLANIDVGNYFNSLIRDLVHAYSVGIELRMDVDIRVDTLSVDALVPLGLLINEVISNSFKHAFKGRSTGTIIVHLDGNEADGLRMRIGDDGVGLTDRNSWKKPQSLGMELIHTLAGQLDVDVELIDAPGTVYMLSPQQQQYRKRA
ncbi:MAG: sensor histidine kinase [Flavobacteriales bacterium]